MAGTKIGGQKALLTIRERYGQDYYARIGAKGGQNSRKGGFAANRELASIAGRKGGRISKRGKAYQDRGAVYFETKEGLKESFEKHQKE